MRSAQEITKILENAFKPLDCKVELAWEGRELRFAVFNEKDEEVYPCPPEPKRQYVHHQDPIFQNGLRQFLQQVRELIEGKGYKLLPWELSNVSRRPGA